MQVKIYYHHTDAGGVVYYAKYLEFLEEARTEFLREMGISVKESSESGTLFVVARQEIDYKFPASYGDILTIETKITKVGGASMEFDYDIRNQRDQVIVKAKTILACVDKNLKLKPIPEAARKRIT